MAGDLDYAATELSFIARRLRAESDGGLVLELQKAISDATRPVLGEIRDGVPHHMPRRGGYAATLAGDLRLTTSKRLAGETASVTLTARTRSGRRKLKRLDAGSLAHPLFGNRNRWFTQTAGVTAGFFSGPARRSAPAVRDKILAAMERVAARATGG